MNRSNRHASSNFIYKSEDISKQVGAMKNIVYSCINKPLEVHTPRNNRNFLGMTVAKFKLSALKERIILKEEEDRENQKKEHMFVNRSGKELDPEKIIGSIRRQRSRMLIQRKASLFNTIQGARLSNGTPRGRNRQKIAAEGKDTLPDVVASPMDKISGIALNKGNMQSMASISEATCGSSLKSPRKLHSRTTRNQDTAEKKTFANSISTINDLCSPFVYAKVDILSQMCRGFKNRSLIPLRIPRKPS